MEKNDVIHGNYPDLTHNSPGIHLRFDIWWETRQKLSLNYWNLFNKRLVCKLHYKNI